ncbi:DUF3618 domain-containing protein [Herbiconiux liukaitaii]|uniref:DUF3618 domain-containing protein n=1 Tax=Herbiconiux liukaitaii TaxID=3342799 RepID=UPI0035B84630
MAKADAKSKTPGVAGPTGNPAEDQLSVPGAVVEVARAAVKAKSVQPDRSSAASDDADAPPQRSRSELQADIASQRARLAELVDELEHRLDVGSLTREIVEDVKADPVEGVKRHPAAAIGAVAAVAAVGAGIALVVRAILK